MAQADYIISNQTFPNTRVDINNHLSAIATNNSGTSAPTTQYAGQFWIDTTTTTWTLYIHDGTDDIQFATIDTSANTVNFTDSALDVVTDTTPQLGGDLDLNSNNITGTGNINITGTATVTGLTTTGDINLGDNDKINLGASNDLQIYHDGTHSYISDQGTGNLRLLAANFAVSNPAGTENYLIGYENGAVEIMYNDVKKLETTTNGITVTGQVLATGATGFAGDDNVKIKLGNSGDLAIYHTGTDSVIEDVGTGELEIRSNGTGILLQKDTTEYLARFLTDGASELYYDNSKKLATTSTGIDVTGTVVSDGLTVDTNTLYVDSGNNAVLVGKTTYNSIGTAGAEIRSIGLGILTRDGSQPLILNRLTSDGDVVDFRKGGTVIGRIGSIGGTGMYINAPNDDGAGFLFTSNAAVIYPTRRVSGTVGLSDDTIDLGAAVWRFDDIYATNGTIQTSDQNEKQSIQSLTSSEIAVAKRISKLFKTFKFNSSVEEKGDSARTHTGVIAQEVQQAFIDEGLDASNYALFISSTWWEKEISVDAVEAQDAVYETQTDAEGNETQVLVQEAIEGKDAYTYMDTKDEPTEGYTEKTRLGIRYPELLSFVSSAFEQRLTDIETRLTALEN